MIIESFLATGFSIGGYFDFQEAHTNPYEIPYFGFESQVDVKAIVKNNFVFPSVGDNHIRAKLISFFEKNQLQQSVLIDPSARVSKTVKIGPSSYIGVNAVINAQCNIGKGVIINTAAVVEHECEIKDFVYVAPGTVLCGHVKVDENTFIGANTVVKNILSLGADLVLGAGSVVVKSIQEKGVWAGNPVKKLK